MSDIPSELVHEILLRLPADSLLRFRAVCKGWRRRIDDPSFIRSHTNNQNPSTTLIITNPMGTCLYSLELDSLNYKDAHQVIDVMPVETLHRIPLLPASPVASCNGLLFLSYYGFQKTWVVWNPLTQEFHELPKLDTDSRSVAIGLGYDHASDDYKVVRVDDLPMRQTYVYSLKMESLRMIEESPPRDFPMPNQSMGVYLNGALHWRSRDFVIALNLEIEHYYQIPLPLPTGLVEPSETHLDALGGCLVVSYYYTMDRMDVWVMKDYGEAKSWVKLFSFGGLGSISGVGSVRPVAYFKNKGHVFLQHGDEFFRLDIEKKSAKKVTVGGLPDNFSSQIFSGSLFRLDGNRAVVVKMNKKRPKKDNTRYKHFVTITDVNCYGQVVFGGSNG